MKDFVVLTVVCIGVVLGIGWLLIPGSPADFFRSRIVVRAEAPDPPGDPAPAADREPQPKPRAVSSARPTPKSDLTASVASSLDNKPRAAAAPATSPGVALANLPLPWDIMPGEAGTEVVETYGPPSLSTSTQEDGHLFETYVYRSSGTQSTVHLEDGKVLRVLLKDSFRPEKQ